MPSAVLVQLPSMAQHLRPLPSPKAAVGDITSVTSGLSNTSTSLLSSFLHNLCYNNPHQPSLVCPNTSPKSQGLQLQQNHIFNDTLFGTFKHWLVNGKGVKSQTLWDKIAKGEFPALPGGGQLAAGLPHQSNV